MNRFSAAVLDAGFVQFATGLAERGGRQEPQDGFAQGSRRRRAHIAISRAMVMLSGLIALAMAPSVGGADVTAYYLVKTRNFSQSGSGAPVLKTDNPFSISAGAVATTQTSVPGGSLVKPSGVVVSFPPLEPFLEEAFANSISLNAAFPSGNYSLRLQTANDGTKALGLSLPADAYPEPPQILNLATAQTINSAASFQLQWAPFAGGTANDFIQLSILGVGDDGEAQTPQPWEQDSLDGTLRTFTIPAGALAPGRSYELEIAFFKMTTRETAAYPGAMGLVGFGSQTSFRITTIGSNDQSPPALVSSSPLNNATGVATNTTISFTFSEPMSPSYSVNWSESLPAANLTGNWSADFRTITFVSKEALKVNTLVTWTLNPNGQGFRDLSGNHLPTTVGQFWTATGSGDSTPPVLVSATPSINATSVALETPIVFQFNEPMQAGLSISWSQNVFATNFSYSWSSDGKILTCAYRIPLPENQLVQWTLNPSTRPAGFRDLSQNALPQVTGSFRTAALAPLAIVTTTLPAGRLSQAYSATLAGTGGLAPYTWSLAPFSEPLQDGLTLTATGQIVGTPTSAGTRSPRIRVQDRTGKSFDQSFSLDIKSHGTVEGPLQLRISLMSGARLRFDWNSAFGESYQLQYKDRLNAPAWVAVPGNIIATGTNGFTVQVFPTLPRFYRLMIVD